MNCNYLKRVKFSDLSEKQLAEKRKNRRDFFRRYAENRQLADKDVRRYGLEKNHIQF